MINASHDTSTPQPWWAKLTSLRAAAAPRIGLATLGEMKVFLVTLFVLGLAIACSSAPEPDPTPNLVALTSTPVDVLGIL